MDDSSKQLIDRYMEQVLEVNKTLNLTRIEDSEHARLLHIEDSLAGLDELNQAPEGRYVDQALAAAFREFRSVLFPDGRHCWSIR